MRKGYEKYNPNALGISNGNFLGLPLVDDPRVVFEAVPFAPTVSYGTGTEDGPANVLAASLQLDVCVHGLERPWEHGFRWNSRWEHFRARHDELRPIVEEHIAALEDGMSSTADLMQVERAGGELRDEVNQIMSEHLAQGTFPVLVGGSHATALGAYEAVGACGVLQIDAHMDLRRAYEGFRYSHASVMYNALEQNKLLELVQVGIRDYCPAEVELARSSGRVTTFFAVDMQRSHLAGTAFAKTCDAIVATLPQRVWISLDVDGLEPSLCANTGTPVPGGLSYAETRFLCEAVINSGRKVVGMDIVEVAPAPYEFEGAVAARLAYEVGCMVVASQ